MALPPEKASIGRRRALGPVRGNIVGEVLLGLLNADPTAQRVVGPGWLPTLPSAQAGKVSMADLMALTGTSGWHRRGRLDLCT